MVLSIYTIKKFKDTNNIKEMNRQTKVSKF